MRKLFKDLSDEEKLAFVEERRAKRRITKKEKPLQEYPNRINIEL